MENLCVWWERGTSGFAKHYRSCKYASLSMRPPWIRKIFYIGTLGQNICSFVFCPPNAVDDNDTSAIYHYVRIYLSIHTENTKVQRAMLRRQRDMIQTSTTALTRPSCTSTINWEVVTVVYLRRIERKALIYMRTCINMMWWSGIFRMVSCLHT